MSATPAAERSQRAALWAVLAVYFFLGALYAIHTPAWQAPDEPAHYNYIRHLVEQRALPVLQPGDYDEAYLNRLKAERFPPDLPVASLRYEAWQPPLYYLLAAPVFALTGGDLLSVRLLTLLLGAGVVILTWHLARLLFPNALGLAPAAAGFAAFLPQHVAMLAAANNDALAEVWTAAGLWLCLQALLAPSSAARPARWRLGVVLGLGFLTKLSTYPLAGLMGVTLLLLARRERWAPRRLAGAAAQVFVPAVLLGSLWWGRNLAVYGGLDCLGLQRHDEVVVGQLRTGDALAVWGTAGYIQRFLQTTFQSFWGQFGWMGVVMDRRVYWALLAFTLLVVTGLVGAFARRRRTGLSPAQRDAAVLAVVAVLLALAVYLYYNLTFVQFQGRYLYPALPLLAVGTAIGLRGWAQWMSASAARLGRRWGARPRRMVVELLALAPIALLAALAFFALFGFIVPQLALYPGGGP
ncbi:MAG: glycosyltransferase family 39 protein [Anaerolineales bacterium]|nr:glycosyltransferase family 39 protein [Anaerolineales bacterium]